jgi:hypothetical protein
MGWSAYQAEPTPLLGALVAKAANAASCQDAAAEAASGCKSRRGHRASHYSTMIDNA